MDRTVPLAAARLLDFIRITEVGSDGPASYGVIYGHNQVHLPEPLTRMTIDEVLGAQAGWSKRFGSSASGGYQFMRETLAGLKRELGLRGTQILDSDLQDRLAFHLLKRRGYEAFIAGEIARADFGKRLAQEWASFPVLVDTKGAKRQVARGQSYYAGDGLNKALVKPEEVEAVLDELLAIGSAMPAPVAVPEPRPELVEAPAPIGHNGGPPIVVPEPVVKPKLSPIEQMNKPVQGAKGGLAAGGLGAAAFLLLNRLGWVPSGWQDTEAQLALALLMPWLASQIGNFVAAYRAPDKRFQGQG